ncbi:MAG TPA: hypothetical protein VGK90_06335 [Rhizomicrobium sp.]|jgi:hypothetical protein
MMFPICIAAAVLSTPAAQASDAVKITFDGACNALTLSAYHTSRSAIFGGKQCPQGVATGFAGSFGSGKSVGLGVRFLGDTAGYYLVLSTPIATGGTWSLAKSADGKTSTMTSGTYSVAGDPNASQQSAAPITDLRFAPNRRGKKTVTISFDGYCNVETITLSGGGASILETGDGCDENIGTGTASKIMGLGKTYGFGWTSADARGAANDLVFTEPFTTGGTVTIYYTTNGISQNLAGPITYTVETGAHIRKRGGLKPISSLLK